MQYTMHAEVTGRGNHRQHRKQVSRKGVQSKYYVSPGEEIPNITDPSCRASCALALYAVTSLHLVETVIFLSKFCSPLLGLIQCHTMHNKETTFPTSLYSGSSLTLRPDLRDISGSCWVELLRKLFKRGKAAGMHLFALPTLLTATWSAVDG